MTGNSVNSIEQFIPGMRVQIRDAEWRIDRVDVPTHGGMLLTCTGHSELVRGRSAKFLTELESDVRILAPEATELVDDLSDGYLATQLYIDTVLRSTPPSDGKIHIGHMAAMDLLPYQLDPALQALSQTRPRILVADATGLGKTIGAGILVSELIRRERGKRILVLAVKSMLMQFQREFWQRFTIPLVRLDSVGLQRVRNNIPTNHNPFHYFDRAIISIDTLKQNLEYRQYLQNSHWDIVVIDEAQNVARRSTNSLRHQLADLLSTRCDSLIMLSATPHDGKAESFASLMNMLDPTAIPNPRDYAHEDYRDKKLVIRRFKTDVATQLQSALPERVVHKVPTSVGDLVDRAFALIREADFRTLNRGSAGAGHLFRTTLEKVLLSSPAACASTIDNRLSRLRAKDDSEDIRYDTGLLEEIAAVLGQVEPAGFTKYQKLVTMLSKSSEGSIRWERNEANDRIVVFTESVQTLRFLENHLPKDLKLKSNQIGILHGQMRDVELVETVNDFTNPSSPLRLLLCSDVASEGLNLHHCSHRLIHFDIPWSLMVFQQRNGRIDRYGQTVRPEIYYLTSECSHQEARDDHRVLEILIEKDEQASKNLGDPSEFMGGASVEDQEKMTAEAMESGASAEDFSDLLNGFLSVAETGL
jgi:SNF2 family DNA or RNA helicase